MKTSDNGLGELLELFKSHPELISALVFDPASIKRLLKSKAARKLVIGVDTRAFLQYIAGPTDGGPIAVCLRKTVVVCPKGTRTACPGAHGTKHPTPCGPNTQPCGPNTRPLPFCPGLRGTKHPPTSPGVRPKR
jgi:hypothetical protein